MFPAEWKTSDIINLFSPFGKLRISLDKGISSGRQPDHASGYGRAWEGGVSKKTHHIWLYMFLLVAKILLV